MLSPSDITLIKNLLHVKTDQQIADILNKPAEMVRLKIDQLTGFIGVHGNKRRMPVAKRLALDAEMIVVKEKRKQERLQRDKEKREKQELRKQLQFQKVVEKQNAFKKEQRPPKPIAQLKAKRITTTQIKQSIRQNRKVQKKFETKEVDYSQMRLLRIDAKTSIYINAYANPNEEREKYLSRQTKKVL